MPIWTMRSSLPTCLQCWARARAAGVVHVVAVATTAASSAAVQALSASHVGVSPTAGLHPNHVAEAAPGDWDAVVALAEAGRVVALGETGLDRHWHNTPFPQQEDYFNRHLELAHRLNLPVIIHCREADADVLCLLRDVFDRHGPLEGVLHSFAGSPELAETGLAVGLHLSFSGVLTIERRRGYWSAAAYARWIPAADRNRLSLSCPRTPTRPTQRTGLRGAYGRRSGWGAFAGTFGTGGTNYGQCAQALPFAWLTDSPRRLNLIQVFVVRHRPAQPAFSGSRGALWATSWPSVTC